MAHASFRKTLHDARQRHWLNRKKYQSLLVPIEKYMYRY
jgi:hypothetical protein